MERKKEIPQISLIVPVFRAEELLPRCVESILRQTYENWELILIDDGSPDRCGTLCDAYAARDGRIRVIHQANVGPSGARNAGLDLVLSEGRSEWLGFIDSDDWVHPRYLELLLEANLRFGTKISTTQYRKVVGDEEMPAVSSENMRAVPPEQAFFDAKGGYECYVWGRLFACECFASVRFPSGKFWQDIYTMCDVLFCEQQTAKVFAPLYFYCVNLRGVVHSPWNERQLDELDACQYAVDFFEKYQNGRFYFASAARFLRAGENLILRLRTARPRVKDAKTRYIEPIQKKMAALFDDVLRREPTFFRAHSRDIPAACLMHSRSREWKNAGAGTLLRYAALRILCVSCGHLRYAFVRFFGYANFEMLKQVLRGQRKPTFFHTERVNSGKDGFSKTAFSDETGENT